MAPGGFPAPRASSVPCSVRWSEPVHGRPAPRRPGPPWPTAWPGQTGPGPSCAPATTGPDGTVVGGLVGGAVGVVVVVVVGGTDDGHSVAASDGARGGGSDGVALPCGWKRQPSTSPSDDRVRTPDRRRSTSTTSRRGSRPSRHSGTAGPAAPGGRVPVDGAQKPGLRITGSGDPEQVRPGRQHLGTGAAGRDGTHATSGVSAVAPRSTTTGTTIVVAAVRRTDAQSRA